MAPEPPTLHEDVQVELAKLRLQTQTEQLQSQKRIERNTFYTMLAVAAHAGVGVLGGTLPAAALLPVAMVAIGGFVWTRSA